MKKIIGILIVIVVIVAVIVIYNSKKQNKPKLMKSEKNYVEVKRDSILVKLEESGEIEPEAQVSLKSKVSGKVLKFLVSEGDYVEKGDIIAEIEPDFKQASEIANTKDNLRLAEIRLKNAKKTVADNKALYKKNAISKEVYDQSKDRLEEAVINFNSATQQMELIKDIEIKNNISNVLATSSGTVIEKKVEEGEMIVSSTSSYSSGTVLMDVADLNKMIVKSRINEIDISKIKKNQKVKIRVDSYPYDSFKGYISSIANRAIDSDRVKVFQIEIKILNPGKKLKPGMTANITIIGENRKNILVVPINTIFSNEIGEDIVYKVVNDSIIESVTIRTGINDFSKVEVLEGLEDGDMISLTPKSNINKTK